MLGMLQGCLCLADKNLWQVWQLLHFWCSKFVQQLIADQAAHISRLRT